MHDFNQQLHFSLSLNPLSEILSVPKGGDLFLFLPPLIQFRHFSYFPTRQHKIVSLPTVSPHYLLDIFFSFARITFRKATHLLKNPSSISIDYWLQNKYYLVVYTSPMVICNLISYFLGSNSSHCYPPSRESFCLILENFRLFHGSMPNRRCCSNCIGFPSLPYLPDRPNLSCETFLYRFVRAS